VGYTGPRRTILVVDDEMNNRSVLVNLLDPLGFDVIEAENGRQALEQLNAAGPDAILMDLHMPVMNGLEAVKHIRAQSPADRHVTIVATSARTFEHDREQSLAAGCDAFLVKPVDVEALLNLLAVHLKLNWIYRGAAPPASAQAESMGAPLVPPPLEELTILLDLALKGELPRLRQRAQQVEQMGEQYRPFATQLCQLTEAFDEDGVLMLIQRYMPGQPKTEEG
jgi:CheY-like chemotaxis protein